MKAAGPPQTFTGPLLVVFRPFPPVVGSGAAATAAVPCNLCGAIDHVRKEEDGGVLDIRQFRRQAVRRIRNLGLIHDDAINLLGDIDGENAEAYRIVLDGQKVGGVVLRIDKDSAKGELELLFVLPEVHSKGIGQAAWKAVEAMHPEIKVWETITPYFEKRNIHFYVNRCGFHIVEFWNKYQHGPAVPEEEEGNWSMDDEMFVFRKVITDKGAIRESD